MLKDFTKEKFDIIIQAGQSNSEGYGFGPTDDPYQPNDKVWYLHNNMTFSIATEKVINNGIQSNFGLSFANEYISSGRLTEDRKLLIIRAAVGGTGFLDKRWGTSDDLYLKMLEMIDTALSLNPKNRLVAFLWHQGEQDVVNNASYEQHYGNLSTLINGVRSVFSAPALPFIAGDFVPQWKAESEYAEKCGAIEQAIRDVCKELSHIGFVESEGLISNKQGGFEHPLGWRHDMVHFSRQSLYEFGKRYFNKFCEITKE